MSVFPLAVVLLVLWGAAVRISVVSATTLAQKESLRGVAGVEVVIEKISPDLERRGLTKQQLQTDVELRLRKAGVRVSSRAEWLQMPDAPWLYVRVTAFEGRLEYSERHMGYVYSAEVQLMQDVFLARDFSLYSGAVTWHSGYVGIVPPDGMRGIRDGVGDRVDAFINDYLAVNPELTGRAPPSPRATRLSPSESIRQAQDLLRAAGVGPGSTDGKIGPQTVKALRLYQAQQGIPVTGILDDATRAALGVK